MSVLTQHYDSRRTGANLAETKLSPATVGPGKFGKLFELGVEGHVYAQPLYVEDVDATYKKALSAGATSALEPTDQPYGDRSAWVNDEFGNIWYLSSWLG